jgi:hypothetical protein
MPRRKRRKMKNAFTVTGYAWMMVNVGAVLAWEMSVVGKDSMGRTTN